VKRAKVPSFRALDLAECHAILDRNSVGRIAFSFHDRVDIEPLHYVRDAEWLYIRTSEGGKMTVIAHNHWVAFEVDEIEGTFDWRSVVVRGTVYAVDPKGPPPERRAHAHAVGLLKALVPRTLEAGDPVPFRDLVFRIHIDEVTGRQASTSGD
jgi:nitroimidazol reductase NimA-like FMN-containing flavoprotein (pyridoxamine 5'-phosphate oxidase superfamily)